MEQYIINMSKKGSQVWEWEEKEGAMGKWEGEGGECKSKLITPREAKLLTCRVWPTSAHSPSDASLRLSGQVLQRIVPSSAVARPSQWQETVGCRAVPLASFTITKVTDHLWNWYHLPEGSQDKGEPGRGKDTQTGGHSLLKRTQDSSGQPGPGSQFVFTFNSKCFPLCITTSSFSGKWHKVTGFRISSVSILTAVHVTRHHHVL